MELTTSVLRAGLRGEASGAPVAFNADVVATAKRDLSPGEVLDGEGGYRVYGKLMPAGQAHTSNTLPIGQAHDLKLKHKIAAGQPIYQSDVKFDEDNAILRLRREMVQRFAESLRR